MLPDLANLVQFPRDANGRVCRIQYPIRFTICKCRLFVKRHFLLLRWLRIDASFSSAVIV